jgi:hypothetical protein
MQFTINSDDDISDEELSASEDEYERRTAPRPASISLSFDDGSVSALTHSLTHSLTLVFICIHPCT